MDKKSIAVSLIKMAKILIGDTLGVGDWVMLAKKASMDGNTYGTVIEKHGSSFFAVIHEEGRGGSASRYSIKVPQDWKKIKESDVPAKSREKINKKARELVDGKRSGHIASELVRLAKGLIGEVVSVFKIPQTNITLEPLFQGGKRLMSFDFGGSSVVVSSVVAEELGRKLDLFDKNINLVWDTLGAGGSAEMIPLSLSKWKVKATNAGAVKFVSNYPDTTAYDKNGEEVGWYDGTDSTGQVLSKKLMSLKDSFDLGNGNKADVGNDSDSVSELYLKIGGKRIKLSRDEYDRFLNYIGNGGGYWDDYEKAWKQLDSDF